MSVFNLMRDPRGYRRRTRQSLSRDRLLPVDANLGADDEGRDPQPEGHDAGHPIDLPGREAPASRQTRAILFPLMIMVNRRMNSVARWTGT